MSAAASASSRGAAETAVSAGTSDRDDRRPAERLEHEPPVEELPGRAPRGEQRQRHERAGQPVDLAAGEQPEDHEQRVQPERRAHHVRHHDVPLELVDPEEEQRHPDRGERVHDERVDERRHAPSHGPMYGISSMKATNAPKRSA